MNYLRTLLFTGVLLLASGCASSLETTLSPDWSADVGSPEALYISPDGNRLLVAQGKQTLLLNGADGRLLQAMSEGMSAGEAFRSVTSVSGVGLSSMDADRYSFAMLDAAGAALIFDYTMTNNEVQAVDLRTGETMWTSDAYDWSLEKYSAVGREVASEVSEAVLGMFGFDAALAAGTAASVLSADLTRRKYVQDLIAPVPALDAFLFKTLDGLKLVETGTGRAIWTAADVTGSGIEIVRYLPAYETLLIATNFTSLLEAVSGSQQVLRVDARTGEVQWSSGYSVGAGSGIRGLWIKGDRVILAFPGAAEVYDLETGEEIFQTRGTTANVATRLGGNNVSTAQTALPVTANGFVYAVNTDNIKLIGYPDKFVRKFNLETGELVWTSDPLPSAQDLREMIYVNGALVAATGGAGNTIVAAMDAATGKILWRKDELEAPINLLLSNNRLYTMDVTTLYELDSRSGEIIHHADHAAAEIGAAQVLIDEKRHLTVLSSNGVASYTKGDLALAGAIPFEGTYKHGNTPYFLYAQAGDRLIVPVTTGWGTTLGALHAIDLDRKALIGTVGGLSYDEETYSPTGSLWGGFYTPKNGRVLYVLGEDGILIKYALRP